MHLPLIRSRKLSRYDGIDFMKTTFLLLSIALVLVTAPALRAGDRLQPGEWEVVYTGDNPHTTKTCFTAATIKGINGSADEVRADTEKNAAARKFTLKDYKFDGTTLTFTAVGADRSFVNKASYHGDKFESVIVTKAGGKESTTIQKGRRLGECAK